MKQQHVEKEAAALDILKDTLFPAQHRQQKAKKAAGLDVPSGKAKYREVGRAIKELNKYANKQPKAVDG